MSRQNRGFRPMAIVTVFDGLVSLSCHKHFGETEAHQDTEYTEPGHEQERGVGQPSHIEQKPSSGSTQARRVVMGDARRA